MRKILFFGGIILLSLLSCGDDRSEDNTQPTATTQNIIGTWTISKKESNGINIPSTAPCQNHGSFIFKADKNLFENYNSVLNNNCVINTDNFTYTIDESAKKITTKNTQNDQTVYTISKITNTELILINTEGSDTTKYTFTK